MNDKYWMEYTIRLASQLNDNQIRVGALLVSTDTNQVFDSLSQDSTLKWSEILLNKIGEYNYKSYNLYLTINTLKNNEEFDLSHLLNVVPLKKIYIGMPDPILTKYIKNDPVLCQNNIYRYPNDLQIEILKQNEKYYKNSKQSIVYNSYYSSKRISKLLIEELQRNGFFLTENDIKNNKSVEKISNFISEKYNIDYSIIKDLIIKCLSNSFNSKYSSYDYSNDARGLCESWIYNFRMIYNKIEQQSISDKAIINVGVGSGNEAIKLFADCNNILFVDIAKNGLEKIKKIIPNSKIMVSRAEDLKNIKDNSFDLYISLRTYNSSFFDIDLAIKEAKRVLKMKGKIILSISNGFLSNKENKIIPGLIVPNTNFVDIYRGLDNAQLLIKSLKVFGFSDIKCYITNEEIYLVSISS